MLNPLLHPICLAKAERLSLHAAWREHIPFGMLLVDLLRPRTLVELGTFLGNSYCALCQAVKTLGTETRCYAIDNWSGDDQAGFYGPEVLEELRAYHDPRYGSFSTLVQSGFEAATDHFADASIDLLHIDGHHSYDSVKGNFDSWVSKVSDRGLILFHDTHEFQEGFGVNRFWEELKTRYVSHFEFRHGHGLGVLAVGTISSPDLRALFDSSPAEADVVREFFREIGGRFTSEAKLAIAQEQLREASKVTG
ncbi:MAG: class I SAM-dependent methyltransferase [Verrucomicrobiota bacterium]|nr:class I SAM-dependent methyltransferase [Verrucomicrobiota bacterium]